MPVEIDAPARRDDRAHGHFVFGQRARFVGGDDVGRAEGFDRREMAHDGVALRHALHAERKHRRHHRRQPFGHGRDRQRDAKDEHIEERRKAAHVFDENDRDDHHHGDDDDDEAEQLADAVEFLLQRCGFRRAPLSTFRRCAPFRFASRSP